MTKIINFQDIQKIRDGIKNEKIVHCHGVFDLFHYGHLIHLKSAKKYGDLLIVSITPDEYVNKGPNRPKYNQNKRAQLLSSIEFIDYVIINKYPKATKIIEILKPDFYVKGPDYVNLSDDLTGGILEEIEMLISVGGQFKVTQDETYSSTQLINENYNMYDNEQNIIINQIKKNNSIENLIKIIESFSDLNVLVVGEPIIDTYIYCEPMGLSSKSPSIAARYLKKDDFTGGSLAIAKHLNSLGCKVTALIPNGGERYYSNLIKSDVNSNIKIVDIKNENWQTPRKTRYIAPFMAQKMFELVEISKERWSIEFQRRIANEIEKLSKDVDLIIFADFGHGMFEGEILKIIENIKKFRAINVQTNSANLGFNLFTKHKKYEYLSIDEREFRLGMNDRHNDLNFILKNNFKNAKNKTLSITLGTNGSLYIDNKNEKYTCPTFFKEVIDTTGAGDAYFAITSLLVKMNVDRALVPFIGNCYAGLKTRIIGNKHSVSKNDLIRLLKIILT